MSKKATIIAVVNQKGGTGKTTTTENLGVGLALEGKKVLLVDTDPQASLTVSLGNPCPDDLSPTLSDLMGKIMMENPITPDEGILHHPEGVDLVPSNIELSGMEVALVNAMSRETILRQYLDHDLSDNAREQGFFPSLQEVRSVGFPAETAELAEKLNDSQFRAGLKAEYQNFLQAHNEDSSLLRFHYHKLERLAQRLDELDLPLREYQSSMTMPPLVRQWFLWWKSPYL